MTDHRSFVASARSRVLHSVLVGLVVTTSIAAQEGPTLEGYVTVGDDVLPSGVVVLHHLADGATGQLDSVQISDGSFRVQLPRTPDPERNDVFFASYRRSGVLYFGAMITAGFPFDTTYQIQAWDTLVAPRSGVDLAIQSRSVFLEPDTVGWRATDLFQLRNDADRTVVRGPEGVVWRHPLPSEARNIVAGEGELDFAAAEVEGGELVVRAAISPGERLFVVQYHVDQPTIEIPTRGSAESFDVLIREPGPALEVDGFELVDRVELEPGSTYRRYSATDVAEGTVKIEAGQAASTPPVQWVALLLGSLLAFAALWVLRTPGGAPIAHPPRERGDLLREIALLDEDFDRRQQASDAERREYQRKRSELLRLVRRRS